jgi:hypothetical protein
MLNPSSALDDNQYAHHSKTLPGGGQRVQAKGFARLETSAGLRVDSKDSAANFAASRMGRFCLLLASIHRDLRDAATQPVERKTRSNSVAIENGAIGSAALTKSPASKSSTTIGSHIPPNGRFFGEISRDLLPTRPTNPRTTEKDFEQAYAPAHRTFHTEPGNSARFRKFASLWAPLSASTSSGERRSR